MKRIAPLLAAATLLTPASAQARVVPLSSCVAMVVARAAAPGELDPVTLETLDRFAEASSAARHPDRFSIAVYAPETRCHTELCNAGRTRQREAAIRARLIRRGVAADRIRLIGLAEGFSHFGRVPERTVIVVSWQPGVAMPTCDTSRIGRTD